VPVVNLARVARITVGTLAALTTSCGTAPPTPESRASLLPQVRVVTAEDTARVRELRVAAAAALERRDLDEALALVEQAMSFDRADARTHTVRGFIRMTQAKAEQPPVLEHWESAEADFLLGTRLDPQDPEVFFGLGSFYRDDGHVEAALLAFRKALELDPNHRRTLLAAGKLLHLHRRESEALPLLQRLLAFPEQDPDALYRLGQCLLDRGRSDDARRIFQRYRALMPRDAEGPLAEASALWRSLGEAKAAPPAQAEEVLALLAAAAALAPGDPRPPFNSATFLEDRGERGQAVALYRRALELDPDHVPALLNLGRMLAAGGEEDEARRLLERALPLLRDSRERRAVEGWLAERNARTSG
jgi:tetratricopeptide (TPR) repeat protein